MKRLYVLNLMLAMACATCSADAVYTVNLNTAALIGNVNGPFALDFQLTSGNTSSGVANTATLSNFAFGTGSAASGSPFSNSGNASGNLGSTVVLNTSGGTFFNEFSQNFNPGNVLSFRVDLTNNPQPGGTPDEFTFQLIDGTTGEISTTDPSGSASLIVIDLTGSTPAPQIYTLSGDGIGSTPTLSQSAPEPPPLRCLLFTGIFFAFAVKYRLRLELTDPRHR